MKIKALALLAALLCILLLGCKKNQTPAATTGGGETTANTMPQAQGKNIGMQKAQTAALDHAGFTYSDVIRLHTEFDYEGQTPVYEVEFEKDGFQYEYTIHAQTGEVLHWEKERD
jgi:uncharacterized membrane protein YkoI